MTTKLEIIAIHLGWVLDGYSFEDIRAVYEKDTDEDPFSPYGLKDIQNSIGGPTFIQPEQIKDSDYEKVKFIFNHEHGFDGNLDFISKCINIEQLQIGCVCDGKISDLKVLENFKNLKHIDFRNHNIEDLTPLSQLKNLEELILYKNPIQSIKPITNLKSLTYVQLTEVNDAEIFDFVKYSPNTIIEYYSKEFDETFVAYWLNDWAFRTTYDKNLNYISVTIEPLLNEMFAMKLKALSFDYLALMKQKIKNVALAQLNDKQVFNGNEVYQNEEVYFLKGEFGYCSVD